MYQIYSDTPLVQEARFLNIDSYGSRLIYSTAGEDSGDHLPRQGAKRRSPESSPAVWIQIRSYNIPENYLTPKAKTQWLV